MSSGGDGVYISEAQGREVSEARAKRSSEALWSRPSEGTAACFSPVNIYTYALVYTQHGHQAPGCLTCVRAMSLRGISRMRTEM